MESMGAVMRTSILGASIQKDAISILFPFPFGTKEVILSDSSSVLGVLGVSRKKSLSLLCLLLKIR